MIFKVFYQKPKTVPAGQTFFDREITVESMAKTHAEVAVIEAESLGDVFYKMNDPWGEGLNPLATPAGQEHVAETEVFHTSMSVNDIVLNVSSGEYYRVASVGFEEMK